MCDEDSVIKDTGKRKPRIFDDSKPRIFNDSKPRIFNDSKPRIFNDSKPRIFNDSKRCVMKILATRSGSMGEDSRQPGECGAGAVVPPLLSFATIMYQFVFMTKPGAVLYPS
nr:uncharacterized protein LOC113818270 [Penaeus vannamei]